MEEAGNVDDTTEVWKDIPGFDGCYQVSSRLRFRSCLKRIGRGKGGGRGVTSVKDNKWHLIYPSKNDQGYWVIGLKLSGRRIGARKIASYYLKAFVRMPRPGELVRHLNDIRDDDRPENICWGTYSDNMHDAVRNGKFVSQKGENTSQAKLTDAQVVEIIARLQRGESPRSIAPDYNVQHHVVKAIKNGYNWKHLTGGPVTPLAV